MSVQPVVHSMINSIHTLKDHCGQNRDGNLKTKSLLCNCRTSTRPYLCCVSNYLHDLLSKSRFCLHTPIMIFGPSIYYVSKRTSWIPEAAAFTLLIRYIRENFKIATFSRLSDMYFEICF